MYIDDARPENSALPRGQFIDTLHTERGTIGLCRDDFVYTPQDRGIADRHAETGHQSL